MYLEKADTSETKSIEAAAHRYTCIQY